MTDWRPHARALADRLRDTGDLSSPSWHAAFGEVPRHVFVPQAWRQNPSLGWDPVDTTGPEGLALVYSPTTLITKVDGGRAVSSSTKPDLMARMLELLDVHDGHRVLEIGTGSGYNAALLSHRLGSQRVTSVDVDPELVTLARARLETLGCAPTLAAGDGADGHPAGAPYDRIIATCSVPSVPGAWASQLAEGGLLLATLSPGVHAGTLAVLRRHGDTLQGRFTPRPVSFMALRHRADESPERPERELASREVEVVTSMPAEPWRECPVAWLWTVLELPDLDIAYVLDERADIEAPAAVRLSTSDGSWVQVPLGDGERTAVAGGPTPILDVAERAHRRWLSAGRPGWECLGVTVTPRSQTVWLNDPKTGPTWALTS